MLACVEFVRRHPFLFPAVSVGLAVWSWQCAMARMHSRWWQSALAFLLMVAPGPALVAAQSAPGPVPPPVTQVPDGPSTEAPACGPKAMEAIARPIAATVAVTLEPLRLPRAEVISDAATQAPRDSFHMVL